VHAELAIETIFTYGLISDTLTAMLQAQHAMVDTVV
jgi:hypothetical protein